MGFHQLTRAAAVAAGVSLAVLGSVAAAHAHVTLTPSTTAAGAHAILEVSVGHGCGDSPTTEITVQMPDGINSVTPTRNPLWDVQKQVEAVDPPITDEHGNKIVERVAFVTYSTDTPLPEGYRDEFELSVTLPESVGDTLVFPVVQRCEEGESAWTEVPQQGQSADDLELPAPSFTLTETSGQGAVPAPEQPPVDARPESASGSTSGLAAVALGAGVLGILLGAAALALHRRRT